MPFSAFSLHPCVHTQSRKFSLTYWFNSWSPSTIPVYWHIGCLQAELKIKVYSGSLKTFNSSYCFWNKYYSETYNVRGCELRQVCLPEEPGYVVEGEREEHVAVEGVAGTPEAGPPHQHHQGEEQRHQGGRQQPHPHLHTNPHNTHYLVLSSSVL